MSTGASEPASYTFTSTVAETLNVIMLSIEDVHTTAPLDTYAQVTRAANNTAFPTVSAAVANSLILYLGGHGSTSVIATAIEGPVTSLWTMDGSAHSNDVAWSIQPTVGTTPANVLSSVSSTTYNGKLITLVIKPPTGGATKVPAYCAADLSKYVDPIHGTVAFRGNTALAGTATTYFGTALNGKTITNATITSRADQGINTYRACGGLNSSTTRNWNGAATVLAAGNVVTTAAGKNILCHVMPYLPADMQTVEGVGLERGIAFGIYTDASNSKIWHVHGSNTAWGIKRAPCIINTDNTAGVKQATGTLNPASIAGLGFFTSGFTVSADFHWTMAWVLDTTTVCGGVATQPFGIAGIVRAVADGHERISAIQQGTNQMLLMQPIQIGDGSKPTFLNLDSTAIEFPEQYNLNTGNVNYCSADNVAGITYYAAAGDVIKHTNALISSPSKYHWRIHASSSASATYDFSGLSIIGAGDVQLQAVTTFTGASFTSCPTITQNSAVIDGCTFGGSNITSAALADMGNISNCSFTSSGTGHAIEVGGSAGTITFTGNTFTGYSGTSTDAAIYVNIASGTVTINVSGGTTPSIRTAGATVVVNNSVTLTIAANVSLSGAEVRIYDMDGGGGTDYGTELAGTESHGSATYDYSGAVANTIMIQIMQSGYEEFTQQYTLPSANATLDINLNADSNA